MPDVTFVLFVMLLVFGVVPLLGIFVMTGALIVSFVWALDWVDRKYLTRKYKETNDGKRK